MNWKILGVVAIVLVAALLINQSGLLSLSGYSVPTTPTPPASSATMAWCATAQSVEPLNLPQSQVIASGCYVTVFQNLVLKSFDAVTGQPTNSLYVRILSNGGPLNNGAAGTVLDLGQESSNVFSSTVGYQTGQAIVVEVCSGLNGAAQSTACPSDFSAGNTVIYYPIPAGPNGQGVGVLPFASAYGVNSLTLTLYVNVVQDKYQLCGQFTTNSTTACTGVGHSGSAGSARDAKTNSATPLGNSFPYSLTVSNTYSSTTFPYEAGFVSSIQTDASYAPLNAFLQCSTAVTGGAAADAPAIAGMPLLFQKTAQSQSGNIYGIQIPDASTQKTALNSQSPLTSTGTFTVSLVIDQHLIVSGDTFTLACVTYFWYSSQWVTANTGQVYPLAAAMTPSFTLTMTF